MKTTVGFDATPLVSGHSIRGIGRYLAGLLAALSAVEHEWTEENLGLLLVRGQNPPLDVHVWRTLRSSVRSQDVDPLLAAVADRLAIRHRSPRLWHHTDPTIPWTPLAADQSVVTAYDLIPLLEPEVLARIRPHRRMFYRKYLRMLQTANTVIAISATTADDLATRLSVPMDRICVVPPFVAGRQASTRSAAAKTRPTFLVVGVSDAHKRVELAFEAFGLVVRRGLDARLILVGFQPPDALGHLHAVAKRYGIAEKIHFAGRIDDTELARLYTESVLIASSRVEGFGLPPVEAILAGGRVAAMPIRAYREAVGDHAVFAHDSSPDALANAMELALETEVEQGQRVHLAERFGARSVASALLSAYRTAGARQ